MKKLLIAICVLALVIGCASLRPHQSNSNPTVVPQLSFDALNVDTSEAENFEFCYRMSNAVAWEQNLARQVKLANNFGGDVSIVPAEPSIPTNYHVVFVGNGIPEAENASRLAALIVATQPYFQGVDVDFAYMTLPTNFETVATSGGLTLAMSGDYRGLKEKMSKVYPVDGIVFITGQKGRSSTVDTRWYSVIAGGESDAVQVAAHETGHLLGLFDGYQYLYPEWALPNTELFFADAMPVTLASAVDTLGSTPKVYVRGTCNGRMVLSFYNPGTDIMVNQSAPSAGFTPLQVILMNEFIRR